MSDLGATARSTVPSAGGAEADAAYVRFDNAQKSYDGVTLVVKSLNLDIAKGEFLTMLGPSGSGKTTCLMMLAGFEPATHGEVFLDTRPVNRVPPHKRGIGLVFQNYALFPHMTVEENLAFPLGGAPHVARRGAPAGRKGAGDGRASRIRGAASFGLV